jgi:Ni,Fe-hydrogenase III small subunit/ferredoxin
MPIWTLYGLKRGVATNSWPEGREVTQQAVQGMPRFHPERCQEGCRICAEVCLPGAIRMTEGTAGERLTIDYGKCVACQMCTEFCPQEAMEKSGDWAFAVRKREDLVWSEALASQPATELKRKINSAFGRSLHIRHVDAGSCNGCESELQALSNPYYNLHRLGIFFTPSPRFADLLLVTGTVTYAMREALLETYNAMPEPRWVMAMGTCAVSGGAVGGGYACGHGIEEMLPVDIYVPGCPPNPAAMIHGLLLLLDRSVQLVQGGHFAE